MDKKKIFQFSSFTRNKQEEKVIFIMRSDENVKKIDNVILIKRDSLMRVKEHKLCRTRYNIYEMKIHIRQYKTRPLHVILLI